MTPLNYVKPWYVSRQIGLLDNLVSRGLTVNEKLNAGWNSSFIT